MTNPRAAALLAACVAPALFWRLGAPPIDRSMEGREALVVQEMVRSGDWILPRRNGDDVPHKPPLMHWVGAAIAVARGGIVDETTTRLPSAIASLVSLLLLFTLVGRERGTAAGLLAASLLVTTQSFSRHARGGWVDPVLAAGVLGVFVAFRTLERRDAWHGAPAAVLAAVLGVTVLAKGPIGAVIPLLGIGVYLRCTGRLHRVRALLRPVPVLVFAAVALPWYVAALADGGALFFRTHVLTENLGRFVHGPEGDRPPWYYLGVFGGELAPWSALVPFALAGAVRRRREPSLETLALGWLVGPFVVLSLSAGKRPVYLLPLAPAVVLLVEAWAARLRGRGPTRRVRAAVAAAAAAGVVGVGLGWFVGASAGWWPGAAALAHLHEQLRTHALRPTAGAVATHPGPTAASVVGIAVAAGAAVFGAASGAPRTALLGVVALNAVYVSGLKPLLWEAYQRDRSVASFAAAARERLGDAPLQSVGTGEVPHLFFYLERHVPKARCARSLAVCPPGWYLVHPDAWARMDAAARAGARVVLEARTYRRAPGGTNYLLVARPAPPTPSPGTDALDRGPGRAPEVGDGRGGARRE